MSFHGLKKLKPKLPDPPLTSRAKAICQGTAIPIEEIEEVFEEMTEEELDQYLSKKTD